MTRQRKADAAVRLLRMMAQLAVQTAHNPEPLTTAGQTALQSQLATLKHDIDAIQLLVRELAAETSGDDLP